MRLFRVILTICRANPVQKEPIVAGIFYPLLIYCNIMEISTYIDGRKPKKNGDMGVKISVRRANKTVFINTGLFTKVKFTGTEFPLSETDARQKSMTLIRILSKVIELCDQNPNLPIYSLKTLIDDEVFGRVGTHSNVTSTGANEVHSLAYYCDRYASGMKRSTARLYTLTADRIREYDAKAVLDGITASWLEGFDRFLRDQKGLSVNGVAQKMRNIRTVFNWCREEGITTNYPFKRRKGYTIKEEETVVNNLTAQEFADLRDYPCEPWQQIYIDMFCLSTYLAGINVGDLLLCRGLTRGRLVFTRRKTDKVNATKVRQLNLPVYPEAMAIINKYRGKKFLLNIMDNMTDYHTFMQHWNKALKKIGTQQKIPDKIGKLRKILYQPIFPGITTYSARYTFASVAANDLDISERTIGMCLGHSWSKSVTSRYINNDQQKIDRTIRRVIDELNAHTGTYSK